MKPRMICGPDKCAITKREVCRNGIKNIIQEIPEEKCNLIPKKVCSLVTKLVPKIKTKNTCMDIPREICAMVKVNPRVIDKPIIKRVCSKKEGRWSSFGEWSLCDVTCGIGRQHRQRNCLSGDCSGPDMEFQTCDSGIICEDNATTSTTTTTTTTTEPTTTTTALPAQKNIANCLVEGVKLVSSNPVANFRRTTAESCQIACAEDSNCNYFNFVTVQESPMCVLMETVDAFEDFIGGYVSGPKNCPEQN